MFLLNIRRLVKGAKQAGLDPNYIEKLSNHPTYKPNDAVLKVEGANKEFWSFKQFLQWGAFTYDVRCFLVFLTYLLYSIILFT